MAAGRGAATDHALQGRIDLQGHGGNCRSGRSCTRRHAGRRQAEDREGQASMKVSGAKETARNFRTLASFVSVPLNATSRFALQPTLSTAKRNVSALSLDDSTGALAASLTIKRKPSSSKVNPVHQVGPSADAGKGGRRPVRSAHLIEFGTAPRAQGDGIHPGFPPKPFLTPAYESTKQEVVKRFGEKIGPELEKRAANLGGKA